MNREDYVDFISNFNEQNVDIIRSKSQDYATDQNPFHNFQMVAAICHMTVEQVLMVFIATKVVRQGNLIHQENTGKAPNNESIEDSGRDDCNYQGILAAWRSLTEDERQAIIKYNRAIRSLDQDLEDRLVGAMELIEDCLKYPDQDTPERRLKKVMKVLKGEAAMAPGVGYFEVEITDA